MLILPTSPHAGSFPANPGGPVGFWFINDRPDPDLIARQLDAFVEQGFEGVILHPRDGLTVPYPSRKWFELLGDLVDACRQRGLEPWFYDENPFPTGTVGGMLLNQHPELVGHTLAFTHHAAEAKNGSLRVRISGEGRLFRTFVLPSPSDGPTEPIDVTEYAGLVGDGWFVQGRRTKGYGPTFADDSCEPHMRAWMQRDRWVLDCPTDHEGTHRVLAVWLVAAQTTRGRQYIDLLRRQTTEKFIELTHAATLRCIGPERFASFTAAFTDEPHLASPFPWTADLPDVYRQTYGDDLVSLLPHLAVDINEISPLVRHRYRQVLGHMWHEAFAKPMVQWCEAHGVPWTGHASPEEDPLLQVVHVPGWARVTAAMHWPGVDQISSLYPSPTHPHLLLGPKFVASLAHQNRRSHTVAEALGVSGENLTVQRMRRVITSLGVCGIDRFVLHGQMMSMIGHRKREAPPSIFCQAPYWRHMNQLSRYIARLGEWLGRGTPVRPIALVYPTAAFEALLPVHRDRAVRLARHLGDLLGKLMAAGLDFDIVADHDLESAAVSQEAKGAFTVGAASYQTLVLPAAPMINAATADAINALRRANVTVHLLTRVVQVLEEAQSREMDGTGHQSIESLVRTLVMTHRRWLDVVDDQPVYVQTRLIDGQHERMLWNPSDELLAVRLRDRETLTGWTPDGEPVASVSTNDGSIPMLRLHPWQTVVLNDHASAEPLQALPPLQSESTSWQEWQLQPQQPNTLVLQRWGLAWGDGEMKPIMLPARSDDWYGPGNQQLRLQCQLVCEAPVPDAMLVWECDAFQRPYTLSLNGHVLVGEGADEIQVDDQKVCRVSVGQLLRVGVNSLDLWIGPLASGQMAVTDPPRLEGAFRVTRSAQEVDRNDAIRQVPGWFESLASQEHLLNAIEPAVWPVNLAEPTDWASTGFPHYSGTMSYRARLRLETLPPRAFLRLPKNQADPVAVRVNGQAVGECCWQPFTIEITDALRQGDNLIEFEVSNTRINQDEGVPQPSGLLGPVSLLAAPVRATRARQAVETDRVSVHH